MAAATNQPYANAQRVAFNFWRGPVLQSSVGEYYVPGIIGDTYMQDPYSYVVLGGNKSPGLAKVTAQKDVALDRKKASGSNFARLTAHGMNEGDVDIQFSIWTPEQKRQFDIWWNQLFVVPYAIAASLATSGAQTITNPILFAAATSQASTGKLNPNNAIVYDVRHPGLNDTHGIRSLLIKSGQGWSIDKDGMGTFTVRAVEYGQVNTAKKVTQTSAQPMATVYDGGSYPTPDKNTTNLGPR